MYKITFAKKLKLVKNLLIDLSQLMKNLIVKVIL